MDASRSSKRRSAPVGRSPVGGSAVAPGGAARLGGARGAALLALLAVSVGCGASDATRPSGMVVVPLSPPVDPPRRPDGVTLEPAPAEPPPFDRAPALGVVALREPLGGEAVAVTVRALFRAFQREDAEALASLLTEDAAPLGGARAHGERSLLEQWRTRLKTYDYRRLAGAEVARLDRIERFAYGDLGAPAPERPSEMRPGDLLARVPVATPRVGSEQLFGDVVILLLRRDGEEFKIAGFAEENGP